MRLLCAYAYDRPHIKIYALEQTEGFYKGMGDEEWLTKIGEWAPKPVALCGDGRILERPAQLAALKDSRVHFVHLAKGFTTLPWEVLAPKTLQAWEDIYKKTGKAREPTIFRVKAKSCEVEVVRKVADHQCHNEKQRKRIPGRSQSA